MQFGGFVGLLLIAVAPQPAFDRDQWIKDVNLATNVWKLCLRDVADDWAHRTGSAESIADQVMQQCDHVYRDIEQVYKKGPGVTDEGLAYIRSRARVRWRPDVIAEIEAKRQRQVRGGRRN